MHVCHGNLPYQFSICHTLIRLTFFAYFHFLLRRLLLLTQQGNLLRSLPPISSTYHTSREDLDLILEAVMDRSRSQDLARSRGSEVNSFGISYPVTPFVRQCPLMPLNYTLTTFLMALTLCVHGKTNPISACHGCRP